YFHVTGVQTCALPIWGRGGRGGAAARHRRRRGGLTFSREPHLLLGGRADLAVDVQPVLLLELLDQLHRAGADLPVDLGSDRLLQIGRASCRESWQRSV